MAKIVDLLEILQRNLNEVVERLNEAVERPNDAVERLNAVYGAMKEGKKPTLSNKKLVQCSIKIL